MLLQKSQLKTEQERVIDRLFEYDNTLLVAKMGGGKTVCSLTAMQEVLDEGICKRILVVAPLKVCKEVWATEYKKWAHTKDMDISIAAGAAPQKRADLTKDAEIVVVNFENLSWMVKHKLTVGFDGLVVDELSRLKSSGGTNFKALRRILGQFKWRVGMTGTPVSEDFLGLYGQALVVDGGRALGTRKDSYLQKYFYATDFKQYNWELRDGSAERIMARLCDLVYVMPDYRDELPPMLTQCLNIAMPDAVREAYDELKNTSALGDEGSEDLVIENAAVLVGKLQQLACGFYYTDVGESREVVELCDFRVNACVAEVIKLTEQWRSVVLPYWFAHDAEVLRTALLAEGLNVCDVKEAGAVQK